MNELTKNQLQVILSDVLNESKVYDRFANLTNFKIDNDSPIFDDIEEFIVKKFIEMNEEIKNN